MAISHFNITKCTIFQINKLKKTDLKIKLIKNLNENTIKNIFIWNTMQFHLASLIRHYCINSS